jgi:hypothetical protein
VTRTLLIERSSQVFAGGFTGTTTPLKGAWGCHPDNSGLDRCRVHSHHYIHVPQGSPDGINWATITVRNTSLGLGRLSPLTWRQWPESIFTAL